ncbi:hypothetical protein [Lentilactobacillus sp. SPB1-3]|uniref:Uncharacterized protein n=1 Tax=Lentilactobacillus terminaliae TaxID=3003483 RepID=A0ACD5DBV3_9LACO
MTLLCRFKKYADHLIIGTALIGIGIYLITHDNYFQWPPMATPFANDDLFGGLYVICGLAISWWVMSKHHSPHLNSVLLTIATLLMAFLSIYQFLNFIFAGTDYMPWISNLALTAMIFTTADRSDSSE